MVEWKNTIFTGLGAVLLLVITLILAGLSIVPAALSTILTAAAVSAAGLLVIVLIMAMIRMFS